MILQKVNISISRESEFHQKCNTPNNLNEMLLFFRSLIHFSLRLCLFANPVSMFISLRMNRFPGIRYTPHYQIVYSLEKQNQEQKQFSTVVLWWLFYIYIYIETDHIHTEKISCFFLFAAQLKYILWIFQSHTEIRKSTYTHTLTNKYIHRAELHVQEKESPWKWSKESFFHSFIRSLIFLIRFPKRK